MHAKSKSTSFTCTLLFIVPVYIQSVSERFSESVCVCVISLLGCSLLHRLAKPLLLNNQKPQGSRLLNPGCEVYNLSILLLFMKYILLIHWTCLDTFPSGWQASFHSIPNMVFCGKRHPTAKSTKKCLWSYSHLFLLNLPRQSGWHLILNLMLVSQTLLSNHRH